MLRQGLAGGVREAAVRALLSAHLADAGRKALDSYFRVTKFESLDAESQAMLEESRRLAELLAR